MTTLATPFTPRERAKQTFFVNIRAALANAINKRFGADALAEAICSELNCTEDFLFESVYGQGVMTMAQLGDLCYFLNASIELNINVRNQLTIEQQ
jgi:hypothetical protein